MLLTGEALGTASVRAQFAPVLLDGDGGGVGRGVVGSCAVAVRNGLQVCCSVLQCAAVCCIAVQCVAVR